MKSTLVLFIFIVKVAEVVAFLIFLVVVEIRQVVPNFFENGV